MASRDNIYPTTSCLNIPENEWQCFYVTYVLMSQMCTHFLLVPSWLLGS